MKPFWRTAFKVLVFVCKLVTFVSDNKKKADKEKQVDDETDKARKAD